MSLINVHNLTKAYHSGDETVLAINDVSLNIDMGEFIAVMGPSGSGKSTLLSILGALTRPTEGKVMIDEIDIDALSTEQSADFRKEYIGFVFQSFHLIPYLNTLENVLTPLAVTHYTRAEKLELAMGMLEQVGLQNKSRRLPDELSGGEQERVAIARALVNSPPIILADEPTGNLDTTAGREVMELFHQLNADGQTIIMVTHNQKNIYYAQRCIALIDGKIGQNIEKENAVFAG